MGSTCTQQCSNRLQTEQTLHINTNSQYERKKKYINTSQPKKANSYFENDAGQQYLKQDQPEVKQFSSSQLLTNNVSPIYKLSQTQKLSSVKLLKEQEKQSSLKEENEVEECEIPQEDLRIFCNFADHQEEQKIRKINSINFEVESYQYSKTDRREFRHFQTNVEKKIKEFDVLIGKLNKQFTTINKEDDEVSVLSYLSFYSNDIIISEESVQQPLRPRSHSHAPVVKSILKKRSHCAKQNQQSYLSSGKSVRFIVPKSERKQNNNNQQYRKRDILSMPKILDKNIQSRKVKLTQWEKVEKQKQKYELGQGKTKTITSISPSKSQQNGQSQGRQRQQMKNPQTVMSNPQQLKRGSITKQEKRKL